ncbi:MAG: hypothetical protein GXO88_09155 [Chlorobi bacterium]|nr:hypothetical protein [Chlorobiota bacterium]
MKKYLFFMCFSVFGFISTGVKAQSGYANAANKLLNSSSKLNIGGYGQIDYNQPLSADNYQAGNLDVHRLILLFGYRFSKNLQFVSEFEFEHVKEVFVEQAFIQYSFNNYLNFRAGLMLVPMGIINEYHEPTTFNGTERPWVDKYVSPTTWREIGLGFSGLIPGPSMKYQVYLMNGFAGYKDGEFLLSGKNGLRKARQKGAESYINSPSVATKIEYYGILGLNVGASTYFGETQSSLYDGLAKNDIDAVSRADSSVVGVSMIGIDLRYRRKGFELRGQLYRVWLSNTDQYNLMAENSGKTTNLGSQMFGWYAEMSYNVFNQFDNIGTQLFPFVRLSNYDTHYAVNSSITAEDAFNNTIITTGLSWKIHQGVALKSDLQFIKSRSQGSYSKSFNAGIGIWF